MTESTSFVRNPQVLFTELEDGSGLLLHLDTKFYFTLNATGSFLWKALGDTEAPTKTSLAERIVREFRVEIDIARRDLDAMLEEMIAEGLVVAEQA